MIEKQAPGWIIAIAMIGFYPVWLFYIDRIFDGSDEPLGVLALCAFLFLYIKRIKNEGKTIDSRGTIFFWSACIFYALYILSFFIVSKLVSAGLSLFCLLSILAYIVKPLRLSELCLAVISLPVIASLNFFVGFPLRVLVAKLAAMMLSMGAIKAEATGTLLQYGGQLIYVDAPCSGIKMLWFSLFSATILASHSKLSAKKTFLLIVSSCALAILANALRVTSLFYLETGLVTINHLSERFLHQSIGLLVFALLLMSIFYLTKRLSKDTIDNENGTKSTLEAEPKHSNIALTIITVLSITCLLLPLRRDITSSKNQVKLERAQFLRQLSFVDSSVNEVKLEGRHQKFADSFPGQLKVFADSKRLYILRYMNEPTRKLHPASDCYRGAGYKIEYRPLIIEKSGPRWGHFVATKGNATVSVKERIVDQAQNQWTEPSSWYWSALLGETKPPWWGITVEEGEL